jgi:quercetin 2,3-dioxygenase
MISLRRSSDRGHFDHGWLNTYHTFSFASYYDPKQMGFGALRVINEDRVQPGEGFGMHSHKDMEIITYVLEGALAHRDSMGNSSVILPGEVQRMSAGTGITHSEFNHSSSEVVHFFQIWILPEHQGLVPGYEQVAIPYQERKGKLRLLASRDGQSGSVTINSDANVYVALIDPGEEIVHRQTPSRKGWLQVARGKVLLNGQALEQGDGVAISDEELLQIKGEEPAEVLLFDIA